MIRVVLLCIFISRLNAQPSVSPANVAELDSSLRPNVDLTEKLSHYRFILIGEMHGTKEPVTFMQQIALSLSKKNKVKVGFEIPSDELNLKSKRINHEDLINTKFFSEAVDGRNSEAWASAIEELSETDNVEVFFYSTNRSQSVMEHDSAMFVNLKEEFLKDTTATVLTISGNIHNQVKPYKNKKKMGWYIINYLSPMVLSINHLYSSGTMYNSTGERAQVREVNTDQKVLQSISKTPDYFYIDSSYDFSQSWNAFLFTTKINASFPVKNK